MKIGDSSFVSYKMNSTSLCIPRVSMSVKKEYVKSVFDRLDFGKISQIDMVRKRSDNHQRVFIHFESWNDNMNATRARELLETGKAIKIIYDDLWFWKASLNRAPQ